MSKNSQKNRDKRKKLAAKKKNQATEKTKHIKFFDGYMKVPFDQSLSQAGIRLNSEKTGDWARRSPFILGESRIYKITAHVFNNDGMKAVSTVDYETDSISRSIAEAASIAFDDAREGSGNIDMSRSYIVIRARKDKVIEYVLPADEKPTFVSLSMLAAKIAPANDSGQYKEEAFYDAIKLKLASNGQ